MYCIHYHYKTTNNNLNYTLISFTLNLGNLGNSKFYQGCSTTYQLCTWTVIKTFRVILSNSETHIKHSLIMMISVGASLIQSAVRNPGKFFTVLFHVSASHDEQLFKSTKALKSFLSNLLHCPKTYTEFEIRRVHRLYIGNKSISPISFSTKLILLHVHRLNVGDYFFVLMSLIWIYHKCLLHLRKGIYHKCWLHLRIEVHFFVCMGKWKDTGYV